MCATYLETLCKNKLDAYLRAEYSSGIPLWSPGSEPPDYWMSIFNDKYAVEMTSIVDKFKVGSNLLPEPCVDNSLSKFVSQMETEAQKRFLLNGAYHITFRKPVHNLRNVREKIQSLIMDYLHNTTNVESAPEKLIWSSSEDVCFISKLHGKKNRLYCGWPPRGAFEEAAKTELCKLLNNALETKASKMIHIHDLKIVVIHDLYALAPKEGYTACSFADSIIDQFAGVYVSVPDATMVAVKPLSITI